MAYILRRADNGLSDQVTIDLDDLLVRGDQRLNIPIFANDLINVPVTVEVTVYCLGEVAKPGALVVQEQRADHPARRHRPRRRADRPRVEQDPDQAGGRAPTARRSSPSTSSGSSPARSRTSSSGQGDVIVVKESFF